jgi:hypothetical protein
MLKRSQAISELLTEKDAIRRDAKRIALHVCGGHFRKIEAFYDSLQRRGGVLLPDVVLTWASITTGSNETHVVFVGSEESVLEELQAIKVHEKLPVPESVAVKMLAQRMVKIVKAIDAFNKSELDREREAKARLASPNPPAWATPYAPNILPELQLSDLPDCIRYARPGTPNPPAHQWQYNGDGKAIFELRKIWMRSEVTPQVIEAAWKVAAVHQVMGV